MPRRQAPPDPFVISSSSSGFVEYVAALRGDAAVSVTVERGDFGWDAEYMKRDKLGQAETVLLVDSVSYDAAVNAAMRFMDGVDKDQPIGTIR